MKKLAFLAVCLAAVLAALPASGATIIARFDGLSFDTPIERTVDNGANWISTEAGVFNFTRVGGTYAGFSVGSFLTFCIEPLEFISPGGVYTYDTGTLDSGPTNVPGGMGAAKAEQLRELYGRFYPGFAGPLTVASAGALQIATWEIVRETSGALDALNGTTRFRNGDAAALALAQTYLDAIDGSGPKLADDIALLSVGPQDLIVREAPVPEPSSFVLGGLGLLSLFGLRRRSRA